MNTPVEFNFDDLTVRELAAIHHYGRTHSIVWFSRIVDIIAAHTNTNIYNLSNTEFPALFEQFGTALDEYLRNLGVQAE